jgi:hypothetical protein
MYGRLARPDEDQVAFAYPLYAAFFVLPFIMLPYALAESFWIALLAMLVVCAVIVLTRFFDWYLSLFGLVTFIAFILAFYPVLRGIFLGQFTLLVFASFVFGLALLAQRRDESAGWVLALGSVKPHVAFIVLTVILVWGIAQRRWRLLCGFLSALALLVLAATLCLPNWLIEFIGAVGAYQSYIQIGSPLQVLCETLFPAGWASIIAAVLTIVLFGVLVYQLARTIRFGLPGFIPTVELAMIVTTLAMVRTATTDQAMLLVPWVHWLSHLARAGRYGWMWLVAGVVLVLPWVVFLSTLSGNQEAPIATATAATLTLIAYLVVYRRSWTPHRTEATENAAA